MHAQVRLPQLLRVIDEVYSCKAILEDHDGGGGGEPFLRVHWVAVPKPVRARRVSRRRGLAGAGPLITVCSAAHHVHGNALANHQGCAPRGWCRERRR
jgi:hypothetical protein